ncbi:hypothetical protein L6164_035630 [Bauhinia variegata]|uniref:Uncharacterized protein n=1 Tax=Bauhinia variegata TaxID=167791 RepID=A0ACB9KEK3_BAUVA|nr:hypothetical protein L6164_035630 [Bauhinia variegata]
MGVDAQVFAISKMGKVKASLVMIMAMIAMFVGDGDAADTNHVYSPCSDSKVQKGDGFSFGIAFSSKESFTQGNQGPQLSPCDSHLNLAGKGAQLAVFRPKIDEICLLTINSSFNPVCGF